MLPGINPRQMRQAMKRMGINQSEIPATAVVIHMEEKDLIIKNPSVLKINMGGQVSFQVSGTVEERSKDVMTISDEDIDLVVKQTNVSKERAQKALKDADGDIAKAIISLE